MRAAKRVGIPAVVVDRPDPLGGVRGEGPVLDPALASGTFVTTLTDARGFFALLGLATMVLL